MDEEDIVILLAEDNPTNILTLKDYLESYGYRMLIAHDGAEAVEIAADTHPDLVLMDIQMPVMDGLEAIRHLRAVEYSATIPIIALTALAMPGDRERCLEAGASEYISKPVSLKILRQKIMSLLKK
jgi:CheY-like chemotaxis protein